MASRQRAIAITTEEVQPHVDRFMGFIEKESEDSCWYRLTRARESGYTTITFNGRRVSAHRFSYAAFKGNVDSDKEIDHLCRDRACVNPDHLELVSRKENLKRRDVIYDADAWVGDPIKRLMSRVTKSQGSCWVWNGALVRGYGVINIDGKTEYVHRVVYEASERNFNKRLTLDHKCRNTRCVNPDHLEPVTRAENIRRMAAVQPRDRCRRGHLYSEVGRTKNGRCIKCYENSPSRLKILTSGPRSYQIRTRKNSESHCSSGHQYAVVGRFKTGGCRQCQAEKDVNRGKRKTVEIGTQFCVRNHDTWIAGRTGTGHCKACLAIGFCSNGHDLSIVGETSKGKCKKCNLATKKRYSKNVLSKQFCPRGHDTFSLGRTKSGACKECARIYARNKYGYEGTSEDLKTHCKNGHLRTLENTVTKTRTRLGRTSKYQECRICIKDRNHRYEAKKRK